MDLPEGNLEKHLAADRGNDLQQAYAYRLENLGNQALFIQINTATGSLHVKLPIFPHQYANTEQILKLHKGGSKTHDLPPNQALYHIKLPIF